MKMPTDRKLEFTIHDQVYRFGLGDFTGADELAIYQATGLTLPQVFLSPTLFAIAALVWRWRIRHGEPGLKFTTVADGFTFNDVDYDIPDADGGGGPPEASAGNS